MYRYGKNVLQHSELNFRDVTEGLSIKLNDSLYYTRNRCYNSGALCNSYPEVVYRWVILSSMEVYFRVLKYRYAFVSLILQLR